MTKPNEYKIFYSEEDKSWIATCEPWKGVSYCDSTPLRALEGLISILPDVIEIAYTKDTINGQPNNPPAFPCFKPQFNSSSQQVGIQWQEGMTLRDYFAIHADHEELVKLLFKNPDLELLSWQGLRYQYADAMLRQMEAEDVKT